MIVPSALLADTRRLVTSLVDDLRTHADTEVVAHEHHTAKQAGRTALPLVQWAEGLYAQVAVSWVLGCVFVRFCEDNGLVADALLSGPGNRRDLAREHRTAYLRDHPAHDDRDWLRHVFTQYRHLPATGDLFGDHNPLWLLQPSADGARDLVQAFAQIDPDTGEITHDFTDPSWNTRFLGDLYQDLSDHAKKQYALLQTPVFVEEFILDHALEPALATFGLRDTDLIDPTCGSGHFLLGAFARLFERWVDEEPGTNRRELARRSLEAIGGVDINPFAVAIARFRLLVAAVRAGGDRRLTDSPTYPINVAVGDSLLHGTTTGVLDVDDVTSAARHGYRTEDLELAKSLLSRSWAAVVGNPPYITVKDSALNTLYRQRYKTCHRQYSLGVPFTERFWQLARGGGNELDRSGYVGMITGNAFMTAQFGKKLIEDWIPRHDLTHLVDTRGAYIPGHGTPTVILFGRNRAPVTPTVRAVMSKGGEPSTPKDPSSGLVWTSIVSNLNQPGSQSRYISVVDLDRKRLYHHPWSIGGGGAADLKQLLDQAGTPLEDHIETICTVFITREDEAYFAPNGAWRRAGVPAELTVEVGYGTAVRDFSIHSETESLFPYDEDLQPTLGAGDDLLRHLWPHKQSLLRRKELGGDQVEIGRTWYEWNRFLTHRFAVPRSIAFAFVSTHNHFAFSEGDAVFSRTAPVLKLSEDSTMGAHFELLTLLNSSTACFWMKQISFAKGASVDAAGARVAGSEAWDNYFNFDSMKMKRLPIPPGVSGQLGVALDRLALQSNACRPASLTARLVPTDERLKLAKAEYESIRQQMVGLQEQLDWEVYCLYNLLDEELTLPGGEPPVGLGQRAFEIVLARRMAAGEEQTTWFERHGSTPITELPASWPEEYRRLVERRIEVIESNPEIGLIERPEYKRRWNTTPWDGQQAEALRGWLLDRLESPAYWPSASLSTTSRLAAQARTDADFMTVARMYAGREDVDVSALVADLVRAEAVPYLAALRYKDSGLRKWEQWCATWDLQRREDAGEDVGDIPVPPRYTNADFLAGVWKHRGKLDVPKERFISYPGAERENDPSMVVGWAGWDHLARARALATGYLAAKRDGATAEGLTPLLAGLAELVPWLLQWHNEPNADPALDRPGSQIAVLVDAELRALHVTMDDLTGWRPAPTRRGRTRR